MANMEKIIRPHLLPTVAPTETTVRCRVPPENIVAQFEKAAAEKTTQDPRFIGVTSSWSYAHKKYMEKQEQEQDRPAEEGGGGAPKPTSDREKQPAQVQDEELETPREIGGGAVQD